MTTRSAIDLFHPPAFWAPQTSGVISRWTQDLVPVRDRALRTGERVELLVQIDGRRFTLDDQSRIRFDILEEDFILTGWEDDRIASLVGSRAAPPEQGFKAQSRTTYFVRRPVGQSLGDAVAEFKRLHPQDFPAAIAVFAAEGPVPEYHILAWWDAEFDTDFGTPEFYFLVNITGKFDDKSDDTITVTREQAKPVASGPQVMVRLTGRLIDAHPFDAKTAEPLHWIELRGGGGSVRSDREGKFRLDGRFGVGDSVAEMKQAGIDPVTLVVSIANADGTVTATVRKRGEPAELVAPYRGPPPGAAGRLDFALLADLKVVVHKIRGVVRWPDSRRLLTGAGAVPNPAFAPGLATRPNGMTARRKRVFILPVTEGTTEQHRPKSTRDLATWRTRSDVVGSGRPGQFASAEPTAADGTFELKFVDLSAGRKYLLWVESPEPGAVDDTATSPEFIVRSVPVQLQRIDGAPAATQALAHVLEIADVDLIDHRYNLVNRSVEFSVEAIKLVDIELAPGRTELRAFRPDRADVSRFDAVAANGERLTLDVAKKLLSGLGLDALPLVPIDEAVDLASERARRARLQFNEEAAALFERGGLPADVRLVLDARRIDETVDVGAAAGAAAGWLATEPNAAQRRCALLESTFVAAPEIPIIGSLARIEDALWRCDAITLADFADISSPAAQANVLTRALIGRWVPLLNRVPPRLTGLLAERHVYLAPGHGLYDNVPGGSAGLNGWVAFRGGYEFAAGEDENDAYMASEVRRVLRKHGIRVSSAREITDFTQPGVIHIPAPPAPPGVPPTRDSFAAGGAGFLRLWQQNPVYYLASSGDPIVVGTPFDNTNRPSPAAAANGKGHDNDGVNARIAHANGLAALAANPIDIYLAVHTNAAGGRGTLALYLDAAVSNANPAEANQEGLQFAGALTQRITTRCRTRDQGTRSVRVNGNTNRELQSTWEHWTRNPRWDVFPDVDQSESQWARFANRPLPGVPAPPPFPAGTLPVPPVAAPWTDIQFPNRPAAVRRIPVAIAEVAAHDLQDDAELLARAWFRRRAGEAMTLAIEDQLRASTAAITRRDMVRMLAAAFGPTPRVRRLIADDTPITGEIARYLREATEPAPARGAPALPPVVDGGTLDEAVRAIEAVAVVDRAVRGRAAVPYTRAMFAAALQEILVERCGYGAVPAKRIEAATPQRVEFFLTRALLAGDTLAELTRAQHAPTRGDIGETVALAMGLRPATLAGVIAARPDKKTLLTQLEGADHADKVMARADVEDLLALLGGLSPESFSVIADIIVANDDFAPLPFTGDEERTYAIRNGTRITFVAMMRGTPWEIGDIDPVFVLEHDGDEVAKLSSNARTRDRLMSIVWEAAFPFEEGEETPFTISLTLKHRTLKATLTRTVKLKVRERA